MLRQNKSSTSGLSPSQNKECATKRTADPVCNYKPRTCNQPAIENYDYCLRHILEDKNAPYRPCCYAYPSNNKRCFMPFSRSDESGYCSLHYWVSQTKCERSTLKNVPPKTPEFLLSEFSHYSKSGKNVTKVEGDDVKNSNKNKLNYPFAENDFKKIVQGKAYSLDCVNESDSDTEPATLDSLWKCANEDSSDAESIDSELDDPLKNAGTYSSDEVVTISRNKLIRLQILYKRQFDRLQHLYREKRRQYLHALRKEKETLSSIYDQGKSSVKEQKLYAKLKAMNKYQKRSNPESIAHVLSLEKRARDIGGPNYKPHGSLSRCTFTEGGVRCAKNTIPLSKFCFHHILEDQNQCLFKPCGCVKADSSCQYPVYGVGSADTCLLHTRLSMPPHTSYPDGVIKGMEADGYKKSNDESEIDASATESAFSTDQRDSPDENSIINNEDLSRTKEDELFCVKTSFTDACENDLHLMDESESPECESEVVINGDNNESLEGVPI